MAKQKSRARKRRGNAAGQVKKKTGPVELDPVSGLPLDAIESVRLRQARGEKAPK